MQPYRVIFNADDLGLTDGVSAGIAEAISRGCVGATTAMAAVPGSPERLTQWAPIIVGRIGAHLQLTSGRPILDPALVPTLVRANGTFPESKKNLKSAAKDEIVREWHAQIAVLRDVGIQITHLDTHHHVHKHWHIFAAFLEIACHYRLPVRALNDEMRRALRAAGVPCVERTLLEWYAGDLSEVRLLSILQDGSAACVPPCTLELMCHPGRADSSLAALSKYVADREAELKVLADASLRRRLEAAGFSSSNFAELPT
jgi:predicted glycoside hydrolase/deacetylase ChbG (UPF0249 family)